MHQSQLSPENLFFQGRLEEVLESTVDRPGVDWVRDSAPFVIGALCFLGRVDEAALRFQKSGMKKHLSGEDQAACYFFLTVGSVRCSAYATARAYIIEGLRLHRRDRQNASIKAYAYQGQAFYRHFCGRYSLAIRAAEQALEASIIADHFFLRMLTTDLLGHIRVEMGEIARGLGELELTHKLAQRLGHGSYEKAIFRAVLSYRVQYGLLSEDNLGVLKELIQESRVEDTYTDSYMILELARQLTVRGRVSEAEGWLETVSRSIYASRHRRQRVLLNLRLAEIAYLRRNESVLREKLANARADLDEVVDLALLVVWQGLSLKAKLEGSEDFIAAHQIAIQKLSSGIALRISSRNFGGTHHLKVGDDPLGDFIDGLKDPAPGNVFSRIVKSGYLGLLRDYLPPLAKSDFMYFHQPSQTLILGRNGDVFAVEIGSASKLFDLLKSLYKGLRSKEELVREIWDYDYNPLRHDSLLYTLISRFRVLLGPCSDWLENHEDGYSLSAQVEVILGEPKREAREVPKAVFAENHLSPRQWAILEHLMKGGKSLSLDECALLFQTSKVTATRDFSTLCKLGHLLRVGKGPATRYCLATPQESP